MKNTIYLSKIEFQEYIGYTHRSCLFINLVEKELSYQVYNYRRQMPAIEGIKVENMNGEERSYNINYPARIIKNEKTNFKPLLYKAEQHEQEVVFSYGLKLSDKQMENLLPYCKALAFEMFRNREMDMSDDGYIGYRDEVQIRFKAISDSHIPMIALPMDYYYDEAHIWPSEKLYRYILKNFFENNKETKNWIISYGTHSLFV